MRVCEITGKRRNVANNVSHANNKTKKIQQPNLQTKRLWIAEEERWIRVTLSTRALRSVHKLGLRAVLRKNGLDYDKFVKAH